MSIKCRDIEPILGCQLDPAGVPVGTVVIHYEYRAAPNGDARLHATRYTNALGAPIALPAGHTVVPGQCPVAAQTVTERYFVIGGGGAAPDGTSWDSGALGTQVQSITVVVVRRTANLSTFASSVVVETAGDPPKPWLAANGSSKTWSVVDSDDQSLRRLVVTTSAASDVVEIHVTEK